MARAPILVIPNAAQVRLLWSINGQLAINVIGCMHSGSLVFNQALIDVLGAAVKSAFTANLATHATAQTLLSRVGIRSLSSPGLPEWRETAAAVAGSATGDPLPAGVALCVTVRTARSGKSFRGRIFVPGWAELENNATGVATTVANTAAVNFVNAIQSAMNGSGLQMAVLTRPANASELIRVTHFTDGSEDETEVLSRTTAKVGAATAATVFEARTLGWESQRRRANGRGAVPALLDPVFSVPA